LLRLVSTVASLVRFRFLPLVSVPLPLTGIGEDEAAAGGGVETSDDSRSAGATFSVLCTMVDGELDALLTVVATRLESVARGVRASSFRKATKIDKAQARSR
jgi:hypothetical protein